VVWPAASLYPRPARHRKSVRASRHLSHPLACGTSGRQNYEIGRSSDLVESRSGESFALSGWNNIVAIPHPSVPPGLPEPHPQSPLGGNSPTPERVLRRFLQLMRPLAGRNGVCKRPWPTPAPHQSPEKSPRHLVPDRRVDPPPVSCTRESPETPGRIFPPGLAEDMGKGVKEGRKKTPLRAGQGRGAEIGTAFIVLRRLGLGPESVHPFDRRSGPLTGSSWEREKQ